MKLNHTKIFLIKGNNSLTVKLIKKMINKENKYQLKIISREEIELLTDNHEDEIMILDLTDSSINYEAELQGLLLKLRNRKIIAVTIDFDNKLSKKLIDLGVQKVINLWSDSYTKIIEDLELHDSCDKL